MRAKPPLFFAILALCALPVAADDALSGGGDTPISIGVAHFEIAGPAGAEVPDLGLLLAERLGTRGIDRVVGPPSLAAPREAEPLDEQVVAWAADAQVDSIVVGRTTRLGRKLSVVARLRSGASGRVLETFVEEVGRPEDLGAVVDRLAAAVVRGALAGPAGARLSPVSSSPPAGTNSSDESGSNPGSRRAFRDDAPISIKSDELEAVEKDGRRKLNFRGHVRATQDDLILNSDFLEAFYPPGGSQPDRLVATDHVVILRAGRRADCEQATYYREGQKVVCTGEDATLVQGNDRVRGKTIIFYLDRDVLEVKGGADMVIHPKSDEPKGSEEGTS